MARFSLVALMLGALVLGTAQPANAGTFFFGKQQNIHKIEDLAMPGPNGEKLFLGHMVETTFFGLGVFLKDGGYVLGLEGADGYYPMPAADKLALAQQAGALPDPLPAYTIGTLDYVFGYSLWLAIAALALWSGGRRLLRR